MIHLMDGINFLRKPYIVTLNPVLSLFQYRFRVSDPELDSGLIYIDSERDAEINSA